MNVQSFIQSFKQSLITHQLADPRFEGCSDKEVEKIMKAQQVDFLPLIYREFLREMGKIGAHQLFLGEDFHCGYLLTLHKDYIDSIRDRNINTFPIHDIFVYLGHQSYIFWYFHTKSQEDDPAVYQYADTLDEPVQVAAHFSEVLLGRLQYMLDIREKELRNKKKRENRS